jgi:hypothetical protein
VCIIICENFHNNCYCVCVCFVVKTEFSQLRDEVLCYLWIVPHFAIFSYLYISLFFVLLSNYHLIGFFNFVVWRYIVCRGSLFDVIRRRSVWKTKFSDEEVWYYLHQTAEGLLALHTMNLHHGALRVKSIPSIQNNTITLSLFGSNVLLFLLWTFVCLFILELKCFGWRRKWSRALPHCKAHRLQ